MTRKFLAAVGLLAASPFALAQSSVVIYGMLDIGVRRTPVLTSDNSHIVRVDDASRSRMGYRIREDIGGGLYSFAQLEHSLRVDSGAQRNPVYWDDKSWVGLGHRDYGQVMLGRLRSPIDEMVSGGRFETFGGFSLAAAGGRTDRADDAWDNGIYYTSRSFNGFRAGIGGRAGENVVPNATGVHAEYRSGPVDIGLAWQQDGESFTTGTGTATTTVMSKRRSAGGGFSYDAGWARAYGTFVRTTKIGVGDVGKSYTATFGMRHPLPVGEFRWALKKVDTERITSATSFAGDVDTTQISIGHHYPLSKRTSINSSLIRQTRKTYNAAGATTTDRAGYGYEVALRVYF